MKTLILTSNPSLNGGISNFYNNIQKSLGKDIYFYYRGRRNDNDGVIVKFLKTIEDLFIFSYKIASFDQVLINTSMYKSSFRRDKIYILLVKLFRKEYLLFYHGWDKNYFATFIKKHKTVLQNSKRIIVLNNSIEKQLKNASNSLNLSVIKTAVTEEFINELSVNVNRIKNRFENINLLFLSRIEKEKGIYEAIDAFIMIRTRYPEARLTIAGDGKELINVKKYIINNGAENVEFLGYVKDNHKIDALCNNSFYIFPSYSEGMPISFIEAQCAGLVLVSNSVGAIPDFFENRKMGMLINSTDCAKYAEAIIELYEKHNLNEISEYNMNFGKSEFSSSHIANLLNNCISE